MLGFARCAEADLIRRDDPVSGFAEHLDRIAPGGGAEILAVHQHHRAAIDLALGWHIHITHLQRLALGLEGEVLEGVGVFETLQLRSVGRAFGRVGGLGEQGQGGGEEQAGQPARGGAGHG